MIESCKGSNKLGEVALVEYNSSISQSGIVFYETLYDENASCHLALGAAFPECIQNGTNSSLAELRTEVDNVWVGASAEQFKKNMETDVERISEALRASYDVLQTELNTIVSKMDELDRNLVQGRG